MIQPFTCRDSGAEWTGWAAMVRGKGGAGGILTGIKASVAAFVMALRTLLGRGEGGCGNRWFG